MSAMVPEPIVRARRWAGLLLMVTALGTVAALIAGAVWLYTRPPVVPPLPAAQGTGSTTTAPAAPVGVQQSTVTSPTRPGRSKPKPKPKPTSTPPAVPTTNAQAAVWLKRQVRHDRPKVERSLNKWMAIMSSKKPNGPPDDFDQWYPGRIYNNLLIMKNFQKWKQVYPRAMLAYSSPYISHHPGWYIVLVPHFAKDPDAVNRWCRREGYVADNCAATRVSHTIPQGRRTSRIWS